MGGGRVSTGSGKTPATGGEDGKEILVSAVSAEQAIHQACGYWHVGRDQVEAEVVREPRAGLLGLGRQDGLFRVVLATLRKEATLQEQFAQLLTDQAAAVARSIQGGERGTEPAHRDGHELTGPGALASGAGEQASLVSEEGEAEVRDGQLHVRGSAWVLALDGVELFVNGQQRRGATLLRESDEVRLNLPPGLSPSGLTLSVPPDEMTAVLEVHVGRSLRLRDTPPAHSLALEVEEVLVPPVELTEEAIYAELERAGVVYGIDADAIRAVVREVSDAPVIIAEGTPAQPGRATDVEVLFEEPHNQQVLRADDSVDYRGVLRIPYVEPGALLARKVSGRPGRSGRTVRGRALPAPEAQVALVAGRGATLEDNGLLVRATEAGRPEVREREPGRFRVSVVPVLTHGRVDLASGNLVYGGDIVIHGDVEESMSVVAGGDVTIYGTVSKAYVEAGGHLRMLGNSFNARLIAGGAAAIFAAEEPLLERVVGLLERLRQALEQVQSHPSFVQLVPDGTRFNLLVKLLVQSHLPELPGLLRDLRARLPEGQRLNDLVERLRTLMKLHAPEPGGIHFGGQAEVEALRMVLLAAIRVARTAPTDRADVRLRYVHNCRVNALGSIFVGGEGSYYSNLHAGVRFRSGGPVRGGSVFGRAGVEVSEGGSEMGVATELATSSSGAIRFGRVFPGVTLRLGRRARRVEEVRESGVERLSGNDPPVAQRLRSTALRNRGNRSGDRQGEQGMAQP